MAKSSKPSCNSKKFHIEVTGIHLDESQGFKFFDSNKLEFIDLKLDEKSPLVDDQEYTTTYSWDWNEKIKNIDVYLSIPSDDGEINIPLFDNINSYELCLKEQDYVVNAILPMAILPSFKVKDEINKAGPIRNGYLYIFYKNKLWREIQVSSKSGGICFNDINLNNYRDSKKNLIIEKKSRVASGSDLEEIYVPCKAKNHTEVYIAYSEVQWSGSRINHLENNNEDIESRCRRLTYDLDIISDRHSKKEVKIPEMRERNELIELSIAEPLSYLKRTSGTYTSDCLELAKKEREDFNSVGDFAKYTSMKYEYGVRSSLLDNILWKENNKNINEEKKNNEPSLDIWNQVKGSDCLKNYRDKKIRLALVTDDIFCLRQKNSMLMNAQSFLQQIQLDAMTMPFYKSAELLQAFVLTPKLGEKENPSYKFKSDVDSSQYGNFNKTLRTVWRETVRKDISQLQRRVAKCMSRDTLAETLKDYISLDDCNALSGHILINTVRHALYSDPEQADKLLPIHKKRSFESTIRGVNKLFLNEKSKIMRVLFGDNSDRSRLYNELINPDSTPLYKKIIQECEVLNDGSGYMNIQRLSDLINQGLTLKIGALNALEASKLISISDNASQDEFPQLRRIMGAIDAMLSSHFEGALALSQAISDPDQTMNIKFKKMYTEALGFAKLLGGEHFVDFQFTNIQGVKTEGVIIGLVQNNEELGDSIKTNVYRGPRNVTSAYGDGRIGENEFSTAKSRLAANSPNIETDLEVTIFKNGQSDAVKYLDQNRDAIKNLNSENINKTNAYEKLRIPLFVFFIELKNCQNALTYFLVNGENDNIYAINNSISGLFDMLLASVHSLNLMNANTGRLYSMSDFTLKEFSQSTLDKWPKDKFGVNLAGRIVLLDALGCAAGLLTAGLMVVDCVRLWSKNDKDAALGTALMAAGTIFGSIAGLFFSATWTFMGMGPVGWISFLIILSGFLITYFFTDGELEKWIKNGPFGLSPATKGDDYEFLTDKNSPDIAYKQLLNLFTYLRLKVDKLDNASLTKEDIIKYKNKGVTHFVQLKSNIAQLLNLKDKEIQISTKFREVLEVSTEDKQSEYARIRMTDTFGEDTAQKYRGLRWNIDDKRDIGIFEEISLEDSTLFLFKTTFSEKPTEYKPSKTIRFRVNVQALIQLKVNGMVFPQPSIDNFNESYNNSNYKENVTFKNGQKVGFWENLLNYTNENPVNYYWLDSRREECLVKE